MHQVSADIPTQTPAPHSAQTRAAQTRTAQTRTARAHRGLIVLNLALLGTLGAVSLAPSAGAQAPIARARGAYTLVGGTVTGSNANAVYVLDAANREMVGLLWDDSRRQLIGFGYRDLANDLLADPER